MTSPPAAGTIRIANCSGYFGDRLSAAREMVDGGPIDVLTGDWLAELTMLILSRIRAKRPGGGFAGTFVTQMEQVMGTCLDRGIKVVSNAGGLDPQGCAEAVAAVADRLGVAPVIAWVDGDDLMPRLAELVDARLLGSFTADPTGSEPMTGPEAEALITANAYFGCWGIAEALGRGADIVITGRVTDAAVVCGPAAWHHGWGRDDWDALAGAVVAGHVIECSGQATGGNYSFFTELPGYDRPGGGARLGYPWADVAADGSCVIGKHDGTGGVVSVGTVTSQLLYEIGGPRYLGPDVTARFDTIRLEQQGPDRVRISGVRGEPPPPTLKVATNLAGGYRNSVTIALTGLDVEAKARFVEAAFWDLYPWSRDDLDEVTVTLSRTDHPDPDTNERATASWRITVKDRDPAKVGRAFSDAVIQTALADIPGFYALSGAPSDAGAFGVYRPAVVPAHAVPQCVHLREGDSFEVSSVAPATAEATPTGADDGTPVADGGGPTVRVPLGTVAGTRSGDKGGDANLGVFVRTDEAWDWLSGFLTTTRLRELLPETAGLAVRRYPLANLRAINFVIEGLLGDGVAASTRTDAQAKSLGEWLRSRIVDVPASLLPT